MGDDNETCDCGEPATHVCPDPFWQEYDQEDGPDEPFCDDCYNARKDDI